MAATSQVCTAARLARLEADEQIRNLVAGYARAYDARDLDALAEIHDPQIREAAMDGLRDQMQPGRTFHLTAEPVITHHGPTRPAASSSAGPRRRSATSGWSSEWSTPTATSGAAIVGTRRTSARDGLRK